MSKRAPSNRKTKKKSKPEGITAVSVHGYKSLRDEQKLEIRPLTLLAGANSSGKSSVLQPLLLLKQTLEASYDPGPLLLDGPNVHLTSARQALWHLPGRKGAEGFTVGMEMHRGSMKLTFRNQPKKGLLIEEAAYNSFGESLILQPGMTRDEIESALPEPFRELPGAVAKRLKRTLQWVVQRTRCFLCLTIGDSHGKAIPEFVGLGPLVPRLGSGASFEPSVRRVIHVPGLRGNPERTYKTTAVGSEFPGTFENYVASIVSHWQAKKGPLLGELGRSLEELGLTWKVAAKSIDETQVELRVGRLSHGARGGARDLVSIADVGFGVSQVLPVVVALLVAEPGQLVYIEQPELHLHPRAQTRLAGLLADAALRGVRVVAETHSPLLLLGVQALAAEGKIAPELVKLHWFERGKDGATKVTSADLDESGAFGDWPEDFADVDLDAEGRYLDAAEKRKAGV